jgi:hypothetical protein
MLIFFIHHSHTTRSKGLSVWGYKVMSIERITVIREKALPAPKDIIHHVAYSNSAAREVGILIIDPALCYQACFQKEQLAGTANCLR